MNFPFPVTLVVALAISFSIGANARPAFLAKGQRVASKAKATTPIESKTSSGGMTLFYGNSMVERMQEEGTLEALLQAAETGKQLQFRSFAYTGDEVGFRIRPELFGDHLAYIAGRLPAERVVMCFGMNEAFAGSLGTDSFVKALETYLSVIQDRHPEAELVLVSPTAVEDINGFPNATRRNEVVELYCEQINIVATKNKIAYVDLFHPSKRLYGESNAPLTINGLHLNAAGNQVLARVLAESLAPRGKVASVDVGSPGFKSLRRLVTRKAYEVSMAYKPANGIHYYGVRRRSFEYETEIPHHLELANRLDAAIWAQAADLNRLRAFPKLPIAKAEPPAKKPRKGLGVIKTVMDDLEDFTVADGFEVNAFASSEEFPELINPLQINFDARGRLWVACFASYPVPVPGELSKDKILIFEDTDGDGQADRRTVFADHLKLPDGFVFYRDGIIVSTPRRLLWLRDTNGDDVADRREEMLRGADDTDTHHGGYLARTPQGQVIYCEGLFHRGQFETPQGPVRTKDATALYLDPVTRELSIQRQTTHPNPWKISYNTWGESMQMFGGGQIIDCDYYDVWTPVGTSSSAAMGMPFRDDKGCTLAWVSSPHFPKEWQGGLVTGHLLSKNAVLYTPLKIEGGTYVKADDSVNIFSSSNKVFRPTDLAFGLDGALYVSDFYYPIIGHAQHSIRDENRDYANGRIWRVTRKGVPLAEAPVIDRAPLNQLFSLLSHPQLRVRELARLELEKHPAHEVVEEAKSKIGTNNDWLRLELLWLFERAKDYSQTEFFKSLVKSDNLNVRRAAARSLRWWAPMLGKDAQTIAAQLASSEDDRTRMAVISVASYLQVADKTWRELIHNVKAEPDTPLGKVVSLASLYDTPSLKPQFPLLRVDKGANLAGWLMNDSGRSGSLVVKSGRPQDLVLGYRGNAFMNLNLNNIPLQRATGSQHTKNGQLNVTLQAGVNKIDFYIEADSRGRTGRVDLYLSNLVVGKPERLTFASDAAEHLTWTRAYDDENATVTGSRIRLKAVPAKMAFNVTEITVKPDRQYTFTFENPDHMLHNVVITKPGQGTVVGEMVDAMTAQPDAMAKHFIPDTDLILFATPQIPYGGKFEKAFTSPSEPGRYPYICTFPGHWRMMSGVMIVEEIKNADNKTSEGGKSIGQRQAEKANDSTSTSLFPGEQTDFHGYARYKFKTKGVPVSVICPKHPAPGKPWLWRSLFWDAIKRFHLADLKLVEQGYHVVLVHGDVAGHPSGNANIDAAYGLLTKEHGFAKKCSMASMSRGTLSLFRWASSNPEKVESIYVDNGVCNVLSWPAGKLVQGSGSKASGSAASWEGFKKKFGYKTDKDALKTKESPIDQLEPLAKAGVPILMVCGSKDSAVPYEENDAIMEQRYKALGGSIEVIVEDKGHSHGMNDPRPVLNFIKKHNSAVKEQATIKTAGSSFVIDSQEEWLLAAADHSNLEFKDGSATPTEKDAMFQSVLFVFDEKRSVTSLSIDQSPDWHNWEAISNIGPSNLGDAPVMLNLGAGNYWMFGRNGAGGRRKGFESEVAELSGFDVPLVTTPFKNQYDAPGGLRKGLGGYHAWQSKDMINWVHHGPVTEGFSSWVTTAEYADGKLFIYYDYPNDQDPHLYIDENLTDGIPGTNMGMAFEDPSHGSDCAFIRDLHGNFHVIYEDWGQVDASTHSWDSPLAGHAVSADGIGDFKILPPAVDVRTNPTGKYAEYPHPHWHATDPKRYPGKPAPVDVPQHRIKAGDVRAFGKYEIHEPEQNAFGDWASICIGGQYYLFADYHPANDRIRVGWFTSSSLDKPFTFCGEIGRGHPDPDIMFAEGRFYLATQMSTDYVSPGPWVETVEVRVGVDTDKDQAIDHWGDWQHVKESYDYIPGFSKQVAKTPAQMDLSQLTEGYGFQFELRLTDSTENRSKPILDKVTLSF